MPGHFGLSRPGALMEAVYLGRIDEDRLVELPPVVFAAAVAGDRVIGTAKEILSAPAGDLLAVDVDGREILIPFRKPILKRVDRVAKVIEIDPPEGLLEL